MKKRNIKDIIYIAKALSAVFNPFYLSVVGLILLYIFSYLKFLPWNYKLFTLILVYTLTVLVPTMLIKYYRKYQGWSEHELAHKEHRMIPFVISILCYFLCFYVLNFYHAPRIIGSILLASLMIQVICAIINVKWKISTHTAAIGGVLGALMAFSAIFSFNPVWWMCLVILMGGLVASSRMILRQHSLEQVVVGFLVGTVCSYLSILNI